MARFNLECLHSSNSKRKGSATTSFKQTKRDIPETLGVVRGYYNESNHTIDILATDSDPIYVSHEFIKATKALDMTPKQSPADHHALNGIIESYHKLISNKVTASYDQAPYISGVMWPRIWSFGDIINNMMQSTNPDSEVTRWGEFTHEVPKYKKIPLQPLGRPIHYIVMTEIRKGTFSKRSRIGKYIRLLLISHGCIVIWDPVSRKYSAFSTGMRHISGSRSTHSHS